MVLLPAELREAGFVEAADCFLALVGSLEVKRKLLLALGCLWALEPERIEQLMELAKPSLQVILSSKLSCFAKKKVLYLLK